jgi:hypothetical protein
MPEPSRLPSSTATPSFCRRAFIMASIAKRESGPNKPSFATTALAVKESSVRYPAPI